MLSNQVTQLERERERTTTELSDAKDRIRHLQDQLTDSQQEAENAHLEHKALKAEFERWKKEGKKYWVEGGGDWEISHEN